MDSYRKYGIRASGGIYKYLTIDKIYTHILVIINGWIPDIMFVYLSHNKKIKVMIVVHNKTSKIVINHSPNFTGSFTSPTAVVWEVNKK